MCTFPRSQIHFVRLFTWEAHISVEKHKTALVYKCIAVRTCFYRKELFLREETLVTVSPCEFPPRGYTLQRGLLRFPYASDIPKIFLIAMVNQSAVFLATKIYV